MSSGSQMAVDSQGGTQVEPAEPTVDSQGGAELEVELSLLSLLSLLIHGTFCFRVSRFLSSQLL